MAAMWVFFLIYGGGPFAPGVVEPSNPNSLDNQLIASAIEDPASLNPIFFAIFNALGVLPGVNLALLLPGSKGQSPLPTAPFVGASFALGYGAVGPYLALRQPRAGPISRSELGWFTRVVTESRLYGAGLLATSVFLAAGLLSISDTAAAMSEFGELFTSSRFVHVSTIDLCVLSAFAFEPIREDMTRRGWWDEASDDNNALRLVAFSAVPVLGPCAYLLFRPLLDE